MKERHDKEKVHCWHKCSRFETNKVMMQQVQYKDQENKFSEQLQAQKEANSKRLEEEYQAKTAEFKKTMQDSIELINKQSSEKKNYRYSELVTELDQSKLSTKQLKTTCVELGQNLEKLIKTKTKRSKS